MMDDGLGFRIAADEEGGSVAPSSVPAQKLSMRYDVRLERHDCIVIIILSWSKNVGLYIFIVVLANRWRCRWLGCSSSHLYNNKKQQKTVVVVSESRIFPAACKEGWYRTHIVCRVGLVGVDNIDEINSVFAKVFFRH